MKTLSAFIQLCIIMIHTTVSASIAVRVLTSRAIYALALGLLEVRHWIHVQRVELFYAPLHTLALVLMVLFACMLSITIVVSGQWLHAVYLIVLTSVVAYDHQPKQS